MADNPFSPAPAEWNLDNRPAPTTVAAPHSHQSVPSALTSLALGGVAGWWSSASACAQLTQPGRLLNIVDNFVSYPAHLKLKFLLAIFHMPIRCLKEFSGEVGNLLQLARQDPDPWVATLSSLLVFSSSDAYAAEDASTERTLVVDFDAVSSQEMTRALLDDISSELRLPFAPSASNPDALAAGIGAHFLRQLSSSGSFSHGTLSRSSSVTQADAAASIEVLPAETLYVNRSAFLASFRGLDHSHFQTETSKHFNVKKPPKATEMRLALLSKAEELTTHGRPTSSVPIKMRDFYKRNMFEQPVSAAAGSARGGTAALTTTAVPRQSPSLANTAISTANGLKASESQEKEGSDGGASHMSASRALIAARNRVDKLSGGNKFVGGLTPLGGDGSSISSTGTKNSLSKSLLGGKNSGLSLPTSLDALEETSGQQKGIKVLDLFDVPSIYPRDRKRRFAAAGGSPKNLPLKEQAMAARPPHPRAGLSSPRALATGPVAIRPRGIMPPVRPVRPVAPHLPTRGRPPRSRMPARAGGEGDDEYDEDEEDEEEEEYDEEDEAELEAVEQEMLGRGVLARPRLPSSSAAAARESTIVTVLPPGTPAPVAVSKTFLRPVTAVPSAIAGTAPGILRPPQSPALVKSEGILRPTSILPPPSPALIDTAAISSSDPNARWKFLSTLLELINYNIDNKLKEQIILFFMNPTADNPSPERGNKQKILLQQGDEHAGNKNVVVDTYVELDYSTNKHQVVREVRLQTPVVQAAPATARSSVTSLASASLAFSGSAYMPVTFGGFSSSAVLIQRGPALVATAPSVVSLRPTGAVSAGAFGAGGIWQTGLPQAVSCAPSGLHLLSLQARPAVAQLQTAAMSQQTAGQRILSFGPQSPICSLASPPPTAGFRLFQQPIQQQQQQQQAQQQQLSQMQASRPTAVQFVQIPFSNNTSSQLRPYPVGLANAEQFKVNLVPLSPQNLVFRSQQQSVLPNQQSQQTQPLSQQGIGQLQVLGVRQAGSIGQQQTLGSPGASLVFEQLRPRAPSNITAVPASAAGGGARFATPLAPQTLRFVQLQQQPGGLVNLQQLQQQQQVVLMPTSQQASFLRPTSNSPQLISMQQQQQQPHQLYTVQQAAASQAQSRAANR